MPKFSVKKPLTVFVAVLAILVLGVVAYLKMTPDLMPNMDFPYVILVTTDPGASPETVEADITKPLEQSMATLDRIKNVTSSSMDSVSMVVLEFEDGVNMDTVSVDIQQKINQLKGSWSDTVGDPYVLKMNPSMLPVQVAALSYDGKDITQLSDFVNDTLSPKLEGITGVESRACVNAAVSAGARKVYLIEEPVAAAIGAGIDIAKPDGHMVVDIGGGTSDIAVISLSGVVESASIKVAGDQFNESIVKYMRRKHNVLVGERTAELMKMEIGCVFPKEQETSIEIKGRCLMTGLPKTITVTSTEMLEAFEEPVERILEAVHGVLERTPPELVADISNNGIVMTGGGSLVDGFDRLIEARTGIHTVVAEDAISCVAEGTGKSLDSLNSMTDGTVNLSRRRQMN